MTDSQKKIELVQSRLRQVPDFPKKGILFQDITPLLGDHEAFSAALDLMAEPFQGAKVQKVAGVEARGFIFGAALADRLKVGFVPVRKPGKLPYKTVSRSYDLEYGVDRIEVHEDGVAPKEKVLVVDDLLATGGTACATVSLLESLGAEVVAVVFAVELTELNGREKLSNNKVLSLIAI